MNKRARRYVAPFLLLVSTQCLVRAAEPEQSAKEGAFLKEVKWRSIGPFRGGRVTAVSGLTTQPTVYYFGATGGGVWKTTDSGFNWEAVSDGQLGTGSVGAIDVSQSDPNVIYVGTGEACLRGNASHGDGVYKSVDSGKTWKKVGLEDSRHIGGVRIHPRNPDIVYVAALGHMFGANEQRGIFRTTDGGKTWKNVLTRGPNAGAVDVVFDPSNPNTLYAGFWEVKRTPWNLSSGGKGSGMFKSTDAGDNWTEITRNSGLPKGVIGRVGITVSPVNPDRVWAIVEAEDGGVFRSDNAGKTWLKVNADRNLRQRAWYYTHIFADPLKLDTVYVLNTGFYRSNDGGKSYTPIVVPHGDNHALWIAANDSLRMIESNDGGANVSTNGGRSWTQQDRQPTAQFYRVALDQDFPYHVYGAQQDNSTVKTASRSGGGGIDVRNWHDVGGGESGWIAPDPKDSQIVYAGSYDGLLTRYDHHTGQSRNITVWPDNPMGAGAEAMKYRFQWNFPILFSPHDTNTLYAGGNILFKTTNEGQSWQPISPDLTRNDKSKLGSSGGPITQDNTSIEYYCTIFTVAESPLKKGVIWTGSDDGLVYVTQNGGGKWDNVTPKAIPEWIQINSIEASSNDAATAYVAATRYKSDDFRPYLYKTSDFGKTWKKITEGIPEKSFTRVIREDPDRRGLLYAGTETGIYYSVNDGESWQSLQLNLPIVPINDLAIHKREKELVAATQGRAFWILDDLPILHQWNDSIKAADMHLFQPKDTYRMSGGGFRLPTGRALGQNPANGVVVCYSLKEKPAGELTLEFSDSSGQLVKKFSSKIDEPAPNVPAGFTPEEDEFPRMRSGPTRAPAEAGLNRFVWDLHYPDASKFPGMIFWGGSVQGPLIIPGTYKVKLTVNGKSETQPFTVKKDPRLKTTPEDYAKQLALSLQLRDKLTQTNDAVIQIRDVRKQVDEYAVRLKDSKEAGAKKIIEAAKTLAQKLTAIEEQLYQTKNQSSQDPLNYPIRLNNKIAALAAVVSSSDSAPTSQANMVEEDLASQVNIQLKKLSQIMASDLTAFNRLVREQNIPAVVPKTAK